MELEINAMSQCYESLKMLDEDSQKRVVQWLVGKFNLNMMATPAMVVDAKQVAIISHNQQTPQLLNGTNESEHKTSETRTIENKNVSIENFDTVAELFAIIKPGKEWEKALVIASYLQLKNSLTDFTGFEVNKELKNLGHGSDHISDALQISIDRKPQLILQLRKEGKAQQARKKYKVSLEGLSYVRKLLKENNNDN